MNLIESPCIRNCCLNEDDHCLGCFRSLEEIIQWSGTDDEQRKKILSSCKLRKAAYNEKWNRDDTL